MRGLLPDELHETYHTGGARELSWDDSLRAEGVTYAALRRRCHLCAGDGPAFRAVTAREPSISLSITWRSEWSFAEADARAFNALLRRFGMTPCPPKRWPARNRLKANGMRIARRIPGVA